jgi:hypothetical protein
MKLTNCLEERKSLVERCLNSESACDGYRKRVGLLEHKCEDLETGLNELGREHQSLQVNQSDQASCLHGV